MTATPAIRFERVHKTYRGAPQPALSDVSFDIQPGEFFGLLGPNGAGKSSFISTLLGDRAPANGEARVGSSITAAWFRQDLADLPLRKSLSDAINDHRPLWNRGQVQNHLGAFGFTRYFLGVRYGQGANSPRFEAVVVRVGSSTERGPLPPPPQLFTGTRNGRWLLST